MRRTRSGARAGTERSPGSGAWARTSGPLPSLASAAARVARLTCGSVTGGPASLRSGTTVTAAPAPGADVSRYESQVAELTARLRDAGATVVGLDGDLGVLAARRVGVIGTRRCTAVGRLTLVDPDHLAESNVNVRLLKIASVFDLESELTSQGNPLNADRA